MKNIAIFLIAGFLQKWFGRANKGKQVQENDPGYNSLKEDGLPLSGSGIQKTVKKGELPGMAWRRWLLLAWILLPIRRESTAFSGRGITRQDSQNGVVIFGISS